jgi:hypothetical protein
MSSIYYIHAHVCVCLLSTYLYYDNMSVIVVKWRLPQVASRHWVFIQTKIVHGNITTVFWHKPSLIRLLT